jgi:hypothetical protein
MELETLHKNPQYSNHGSPTLGQVKHVKIKLSFKI